MRFLKGTVSSVDAIDKMIDTLIQSRDSALDVCRLLNQVIVSFTMIRHMALKGMNLHILLDVLQ